MKLKLAFGFLPYLLIEKDLGGTKLGSSKLFFVWLDDEAHDTTDEHEEMHVLWWYITTVVLGSLAMGVTHLLPDVAMLHPLWAFLGAAFVDPLLGTFAGAYKRFDEALSYAWATNHKKDPEAYLYKIADPNSTQSQRYGKDFHKRVRKWYQRFK